MKKTFERTIRELCVDILSEPTPEALPDKIIDHLQNTFSVQWSTLWLTEQIGNRRQKQLRLAAAGGDAKKLLTARTEGPRSMISGKDSRARSPSERKLSTSKGSWTSKNTSMRGNTIT